MWGIIIRIDYDKVSEIYDKVRVGDPFVIKYILDAGCGTGNNTVLISEVTDAAVYGMDRSEGIFVKAREVARLLSI